MPIPELTPEVVQGSRSQAELGQWLDTTIEEFGKTPEGKRAWRLYQGGCVKNLVEELLPIRWYADAFHQGDTGTRFEVVIGNQSFDAIVRDPEKNVVCYLQITLAFDGYQSRLRMEHMTQYGHAPMTGVVLERGKGGSIPETYAECENKDDRIAAEFEQILTAFRKKAEKRYEENTKLVVCFRSDGIVDEDYMHRLDAFIQEQVLPIEHGFAELVFVSGINGHHLSYAPKGA
jgi:hypothetical protein